jgi:hypothetical protein
MNFSNLFQPVISCPNLLKGFSPPGGWGCHGLQSIPFNRRILNLNNPP